MRVVNMKKRIRIPFLGSYTPIGHLKNIAGIVGVCAFVYFVIFIPLSFYLGLGIDIAEGAAHTLNK